MKKGIVLLVSLSLIAVLSGVVFFFLDKEQKVHEDFKSEQDLIQANLILHSLAKYLKKIKFDEEKIFYGSKAPIVIDLADMRLKIKIDSRQKLFDLNALVKSAIKDDASFDKLVDFFKKFEVKDPNYFVELLLDTVDKDTIDRNGVDSEIVNERQNFRNGKIYSQRHLENIIEYYVQKRGDTNIYNVPFDEYFNFTFSKVDINFMDKKRLYFLFDDANSFVLDQISLHYKIYKKSDDTPFDFGYKKKLSTVIYGQYIVYESSVIGVKVDILGKEKKSSFSFDYDIKANSMSNIRFF